MKKVARGQDFSGVRPLRNWGVGGVHRWRFQDEVPTKIVPNITPMYFMQFFNHCNLNSTTVYVLSILFLYGIQ